MNSIIELLKNKILLLTVIVVIISIIIYVLVKKDNFSKLPPHIENLSLKQLIPQLVPPIANQKPNTNLNYNTNINAPNYGKTDENNNIKNTLLKPNNIYRINTGRDAYKQEEFVSIYDSNFGGMLGTTLGCE